MLSKAWAQALSLPWSFLRPSPSGGVSLRSCAASIHIHGRTSLRGTFTELFTRLSHQTMRVLKAATSLMIHLCIPSYFWYIRCFFFDRLLGQGWETQQVKSKNLEFNEKKWISSYVSEWMLHRYLLILIEDFLFQSLGNVEIVLFHRNKIIL